MKRLYKKAAFTLIEIIIYMATFAFFAILVLGFFINTQKKIFLDSVKNEKIVRNNIALDLIKRDLICASCYKNEWDVQNFVFQKNVLDKNGAEFSVCVGWQLLNGVLVRIEGDYNFLSNKWLKKIVSKVQTDLKNFNFAINESNDKKYIYKIKLNLDSNELVDVVLRNRKVRVCG